MSNTEKIKTVCKQNIRLVVSVSSNSCNQLVYCPHRLIKSYQFFKSTLHLTEKICNMIDI